MKQTILDRDQTIAQLREDMTESQHQYTACYDEVCIETKAHRGRGLTDWGGNWNETDDIGQRSDHCTAERSYDKSHNINTQHVMMRYI